MAQPSNKPTDRKTSCSRNSASIHSAKNLKNSAVGLILGCAHQRSAPGDAQQGDAAYERRQSFGCNQAAAFTGRVSENSTVLSRSSLEMMSAPHMAAAMLNSSA